MLEALEDSRDVALRHLKRIRNRNAETVIPDRQQHRDLQDANRVDRFPEQSFRASGVADGSEHDFIAVRGKRVAFRELGHPSVEFRRVGEPYQARHLRRCWREVCRGVVAIGLGKEVSLLIEQARREMARYGTPAKERFGYGVGVSV